MVLIALFIPITYLIAKTNIYKVNNSRNTSINELILILKTIVYAVTNRYNISGIVTEHLRNVFIKRLNILYCIKAYTTNMILAKRELVISYPICIPKYCGITNKAIRRNIFIANNNLSPLNSGFFRRVLYCFFISSVCFLISNAFKAFSPSDNIPLHYMILCNVFTKKSGK